MDHITLILIASGLFVLWLFGPIAIVSYRVMVVPRRYKEIADRFLQPPTQEVMLSDDERNQSGAWHYARLFDPDAQPADAEQAIRDQFYFFHGWGRYLSPFLLILVLSGLMLSFSGFWLADALGTPSAQEQKSGAGKTTVANSVSPPETPASNEPGAVSTSSFIGRVKSPFIMALWGAFVWSLYEILTRRKSGDLTPIELYGIAFRYASAIPIGYAFSLLVFDTVPGFLAFAISGFPLRDVQQLLRKQALKKLGDTTQANASSTKGYLGEIMSGMGDDTIARLQELDIETYLDLAYTDPVKLLIKTGVPIQLVLAWVDQALLSVYAAPFKAQFEKLGMPCALDLCEFYARHCFDVATKTDKDWANDTAVLDLSQRLGIPAELLVHQLLRGVFEDPHSQFLIRIWCGPAKSPDSI